MELDFDKMGGLVPAIIQDAETGKVLMLAYMNSIAWEKNSGNRKSMVLQSLAGQAMDEGGRKRQRTNC
jgi:phosphoribosyl-AMP cyclohydrolase